MAHYSEAHCLFSFTPEQPIGIAYSGEDMQSLQLLVQSSQNSGTVERIRALDLVVAVILIRASLIPPS
jgi:hypothetical protein